MCFSPGCSPSGTCASEGNTPRQGPLFRAVRKGGRVGERLHPCQVPRIFKAMAREAGLPEAIVAGLSGHSARVGAAQDMVAAGIELPASRERFLTEEEFRRLGRVLDEAGSCKGVSVHAVAAIRLLLLTGCRKGEILNLRWDQVDLEAGELNLPETKTGPRTIVLSPEAVSVLRRIPRLADNPHVIPGKIRGRPMRNLNDPWEIVCERAGLADMRLHDCRHSYASRALALGESLPMIGRLLGHTQVETTARYAHLAEDSVKESAARVAESIAADLLPQYGAHTPA